MKKILALIFAVLCLSSMSVLAVETTEAVEDMTADITAGFDLENGVITFNEDYTELYYNQERFIMAKLNSIRFEGFDAVGFTVELTDDQKNEIDDTEFNVEFSGTVIEAVIEFKSGSTMFAYYVKESKVKDYEAIQSAEWEKGEIDFYWPEENKVSVTRGQLTTNLQEIQILEIDSWDYFDVNAVSSDNELRANKGKLLVKQDEYYYIDFAVTGITDTDGFFIYDYDKLSVYKITDEALCEQIEAAIEKNYGDDYGFLYNDEFTTAVSDILLVIVFGIIPFGVFVVFLISAIRSKTKYKKFYRTVYISALVEIIVFIALVSII